MVAGLPDLQRNAFAGFNPRYLLSGCVMPTVLRSKGYRFHYYSDEGNEPPHVHVEHGEKDAKIWLGTMNIAYSYGFTKKQEAEIIEIL
jgi:hypothetical protein